MTLFHLAALILFATWLGSVLPQMALIPVLIAVVPLAFFRPTRLLALIALIAALTLWRFSPPPLPPSACSFHATISDFAIPMQPRGQRVTAHIEHSDNCPSINGARLLLFDYDAHPLTLASRWHIQATLRHGDDTPVILLATLKSATPLPASTSPILRLRAALNEHIRARFSAQDARWYQALLIGNRSALDSRDRTLLRHTGTSHLLAISGLHDALVALMAYQLGKTLFSLNRRLALAIAPRDLALIFMLIAALAYVILSGAQAPAQRAWLMLACISLHWFIPRIKSGIHGLALAAILSLLIDPAILFALGAWLSYLATLAALLAWQRYKRLPALGQWPLLQAWITAALLPLTWAWFSGIPLYAWLVNLIVIPWLGALLLLGFLALVSAALLPFAHTLLSHYLATLHTFADLPFAYLEPRWQPSTLTALLAYLLILLWLARRPRKRWLTLALILALFWQLQPRNTLLTYANGNAALLHGDSASVIINPGYRYRDRDDAARYLLPELRRRGRVPLAIVITADKKRAHSALQTVLDAYPGTPVYSLVLLKNFPFAYEYCPRPPFAADCSWAFASYRISTQGVNKL